MTVYSDYEKMRHGPARKLSSEKEKEIVERYAAVQSTHKLAAEYGVSPITVSRTLQRAGIVVGRNGRSLSNEEKEIAKQMVRDGASIRAVAEHFDINKRTATAAVRSEKPKGKPRGRGGAPRSLTPEEEVVVGERYLAGEPTTVLAVDFHVNACTINLTLRRRGIDLRRPWQDRTEEQKAATLRARMSDAKKRLRSLLMMRRSTASERGLVFDPVLFETLPKDPPTNCACCDVLLDFSEARKRGAARAPSIDRVDNSLGYIPGNVAVICLRCNRLKSDASLVDLKNMAAYVERCAHAKA